MDKYKALIRTTVGEYLSSPSYCGAGVYVVACYPSLGCVYIGISNSVEQRIRQHTASDTYVGNMLRANMADAYTWRLDILVPPDVDNVREWMIQAERRLVTHFKPLANTAGTA